MSQINQLLIDADAAMQSCDWDRAQALYRQALDVKPNYPGIELRLRHAQGAVTKESDLDARIAAADNLMVQGQYQEAALEYGRIMEYAAGTPRILKFHTRLEQSRNQAKDLLAWDERVQGALQQAGQQNQQGDWNAVGKIIDDMLCQLPPDPLYGSLVAALEEVRTAALQQGDHRSLYEKAITVLRENDYTRGIELLEMIPTGSQMYLQAERLLIQVQERQRGLERDLAPVASALQENRLGDALAELEQTRAKHKTVPRWRRLYLQAGVGAGRSLLENARQRNAQRDFAGTAQCFSDAQKVFEKVLQLYPAHLDVQPLRDECVDAVAIAGFEAQAQLDEANGQRDAALAAWKKAQQRLDFSRSQGRDYATLRAVVETEHSRLENDIKRIRQEERCLLNAKSKWENNHLREAQQMFQETLDALLSEHRKRAVAGLREVEAKIQQFEVLLERGDAADDSITASQEYQKAYDLWLGGPGVAQRLETALVTSCKLSLSQGRVREAVGYGNSALKLNPDNRDAKSCVDKAGVKPLVEETLERVRGNLATLQRQDEIHASELAPLLDELEAVLQKASPWPELSQQLVKVYEEVKALQGTWQQYEQQYARAVHQRDVGAWGDAVEVLDQALLLLGERVPLGVQTLRRAWARIVEQAAMVERDASAALESAGKAYTKVAEIGQLSDIGDALDKVLRTLEPALKQLAGVKGQVEASSGPIPVALLELQKRTDALKTRASAARDVATTLSASDGLPKIREAIRVLGDDPVFATVQAQLKMRAGTMLAHIKHQAQTAIQAGALTEAEEKLGQVQELDPGDTETAQLYAEIRQRRMLEDKFRQVMREAETQLAGNSLVDAIGTFRRGLDILLEPDIPIPVEARQILLNLTALSDRENKTAFAQPKNWKQAEEMMFDFAKLRTENWVIARVVPILEKWIPLAHDHAQRSIVASSAELGDLLNAFRVAADYLLRHPTDAFAIEQKTNQLDGLLNKLCVSTTKRVHRAQSALEDGDFKIALNNLHDIEAKFYAPIEEEFPGLLDGYEQVQAVRDEVVQLQAESEKLLSLDTQTQPKLKTAREAYQNRDWNAAEKVLELLPVLQLKDELPNLYVEVEEMRAQIVNCRKSAARMQLQQVMSRIETGLNLVTKTGQMDEYLRELETLRLEINLQLLDVDERNRYFDLLTRGRAQRESMAAGAMWEAKIEEYLRDKNYQDALDAVDEALLVTRDATSTVHLKSRRKKIAKLAQEQQERETLLAQGQMLFAAGKYVEARSQFTQAKQKGIEVTEWLAAARAGALLVSAQKIWDEKHDGQNTLLDLDESLRLAKDNLLTDDIADEAQRLRRQINFTLKDSRATLQFLAEARRLLMEDDLAGAQVSAQKALERTPRDPDALMLQTQIREQVIARNMLAEAKIAQAEDRDKDALQRVNAILEIVPTSLDARLLKQQLEARKKEGEIFVEVEMLAESQHFQEADEKLMELSRQGVDPERLRATQKLIKDLEYEALRKLIQPIEDDYRDGLYAEAWSLGKQALERTVTPKFLDKLNHLQGRIVNRWAEKQAGDAREALQQHPSADQLRALEAQLDPLLTIEPAVEVHWRRQIDSLLLEACTQRLRGHIEQARAQYGLWIADGSNREPQGALNILKSVQEEVEKLGQKVDINVFLDATTLEGEIQEAVQQREEQGFKSQRDQLFNTAYELQQKLVDPAYPAARSPGRGVLEQIQEKVNCVFKIAGYENDGPAHELLTWVRSNLKDYDSTQNALNEAQDLVGKRDFRGGDNALRRAGVVSSLLKAEHDHWREVVSALRRAATAQNSEIWDDALRDYQQALACEPGIEVVIEKDLERCYQNLLQKLRETVSQALNQTPPGVDTARIMLTRAENSGWITAHHQRDYDQLRDWLTSQEQVALAAELLQREDGDLDVAAKALKDAGRLLPRDQFKAKDSIRHWESLVNALRAWDAYQQDCTPLSRTLNMFKALRSPIVDLARVQRILQHLEDKTEQERIADEEVREREQLLKLLRSDIDTALSRPLDYGSAVCALESASSKIAGEADFEVLCQRVQNDLCMAMETAVKELQYARGLELADILKRVPLLDSQIRSRAIGLSDERVTELNAKLQEAGTALEAHDEVCVLAALKDAERIAAPTGDSRINDMYARLENNKLEDALSRAEQALEEYIPSGVESALKAARQIAGAAGDARIAVFEQRLSDLRRLLDTVDASLREADILMGQEHWPSATERLLGARNDSPRYKPVTAAIHDLQARLVAQAEVSLKAGKFAQGLSLCELSQRLDLRDDVCALRERILAEQEACVVGLRKQVRVGLDAWRLDPVSGWLERGLKIAPKDSELLRLNQLYQDLTKALPSIRQQMMQGWEQLQQRESIAAIASFESVKLAAPQPLPEAELWRDYARALRDVARLAEDSTDFGQVARLLGDADVSMRVSDAQLLPDIFSSVHHLEDRHRHAAFNAWRLRQSARKMDMWYRASDEYCARDDSESMVEGMRLFDLVIKEQESFKRDRFNPMTPPDSFPVTGMVDEVLPSIVSSVRNNSISGTSGENIHQETGSRSGLSSSSSSPVPFKSMVDASNGGTSEVSLSHEAQEKRKKGFGFFNFGKSRLDEKKSTEDHKYESRDSDLASTEPTDISELQFVPSQSVASEEVEFTGIEENRDAELADTAMDTGGGETSNTVPEEAEAQEVPETYTDTEFYDDLGDFFKNPTIYTTQEDAGD